MLPILVTKPNLGPLTLTDHLTCLLGNLCAGQEAKLGLDMEQQTVFKSGKEYVKAEYCQLAILTIFRVHHETCWVG